jgi:hypothetical protein
VGAKGIAKFSISEKGRIVVRDAFERQPRLGWWGRWGNMEVGRQARRERSGAEIGSGRLGRFAKEVRKGRGVEEAEYGSRPWGLSR